MNLNAEIPMPGSAVVDQRGMLTDVWWQFFQIIWNRTGASQGGDLEIVIKNIRDLESAVLDDPAGPSVAYALQKIEELSPPQDVLQAAMLASIMQALAGLSARVEGFLATQALPQLNAPSDVLSMAIYKNGPPPEVPVYTGLATPSSDGLMSAADKAKLDSL
jgi:hypothetical protein